MFLSLFWIRNFKSFWSFAIVYQKVRFIYKHIPYSKIKKSTNIALLRTLPIHFFTQREKWHKNLVGTNVYKFISSSWLQNLNFWSCLIHFNKEIVTLSLKSSIKMLQCNLHLQNLEEIFNKLRKFAHLSYRLIASLK